MKNIRIISRMDIKNEFVIKGIQMEGLRKLGDPNEFAIKYYNEGIDEIIFVDVVASYYDRNHLFNIIDKICENVFVPITICGGVRKIEDIEKLLTCGADKVAINTAAIKDINLLKESTKIFGSQSIISSIEAKKNDKSWLCYYDSGREPSNKKVIEWVKEIQDCGIGEILLTSIDKDGTKRGMDIDLIEEISKISRVPLIVSGGIGRKEHLDYLKDIDGVDGIALASSLHYSLLDILEVKEYISNLGYEIRK